MAIDTRNKRASCIGVGSPVPRVLPNPDGTINTNDRVMLAYAYAGIIPSAPPSFNVYWAMRSNLLLGGGDV